MTAPICVTLVTLMPDGRPQGTVVWRMYEAPYIVINTVKYSQKVKNITRDPRVTVVSVDTTNPYRYMEVRGVVERIEDDPDAAMIDRISMFYDNQPYYGGSEPMENKGEVEHVTFYIKPLKVNVQ